MAQAAGGSLRSLLGARRSGGRRRAWNAGAALKTVTAQRGHVMYGIDADLQSRGAVKGPDTDRRAARKAVPLCVTQNRPPASKRPILTIGVPRG